MPSFSLPSPVARSQVWQWVHNSARLDGGPVVTPELVRSVLDEEVAKRGGDRGASLRPAPSSSR
jgi:malate synthase